MSKHIWTIERMSEKLDQLFVEHKNPLIANVHLLKVMIEDYEAVIVKQERDCDQLQKLADAVLLFADEYNLNSWVEDDAVECRTNTPEQKLHAAISEYKTGTPTK